MHSHTHTLAHSACFIALQSIKSEQSCCLSDCLSVPLSVCLFLSLPISLSCSLSVLLSPSSPLSVPPCMCAHWYLFIIKRSSVLNNYIRQSAGHGKVRGGRKTCQPDANLIDSYEDCQTHNYNTHSHTHAYTLTHRDTRTHMQHMFLPTLICIWDRPQNGCSHNSHTHTHSHTHTATRASSHK